MQSIILSVFLMFITICHVITDAQNAYLTFIRNPQDLNHTHTLCIQMIEKNVNLVLCIEETEVKTKPQKDCTFW